MRSTRRPSWAHATLLAALALPVAACSPSIGDSCSSSLDCSVQGDRICDRASPDGYCTIPNCEPDECPAESICVEFFAEPQRLSRRYCMKRCGSDGDCREGEGYRCVRGTELLDEAGEPIAASLDGNTDRRFCAYGER